MLRALTSAGLAVLALTLVGGSAQAKTPSWLLTGGDLGSHGYHFFAVFDGEILQTPVESADAERLVASSSAYDLYSSYGNLAVPYEMATRGPAFRYYPDAGLIEQPASRRWYEPAPEVEAELDDAITTALARKAAGKLEADPIAADFRARHLDTAGYWMRPVADVPLGSDRYFAPMGCRERCTPLGLGEGLVMRHLVETLETPLQPPSAVSPEFVIEYYGVVGNGGIVGLLGFYAPPEDGRPGRFWYDGYFHDQAMGSHATTPGFDAVIADALERPAQASPGAPPPVASAAEEEGRGPSLLRTIVGGSAALAIASAMFVTLAARRLRS